jgi:hypothetical protein
LMESRLQPLSPHDKTKTKTRPQLLPRSKPTSVKSAAGPFGRMTWARTTECRPDTPNKGQNQPRPIMGARIIEPLLLQFHIP